MLNHSSAIHLCVILVKNHLKGFKLKKKLVRKKLSLFCCDDGNQVLKLKVTKQMPQVLILINRKFRKNHYVQN